MQALYGTPAPAITSSLNASAQIGTGFGYQIKASGSPKSYQASGLPAGLSLDPAAGTISGTPTQAGTFSVTVSASNAVVSTSATLTAD